MTAPNRAASWSQPWRDIASPELSAALAAIGSRRRLADGALLYARGDPGSELYGVHSGAIRLAAHTQDGDEALLGLYPPGSWFGEMSMFDELPRPTSAYAVGETELLVVPAARLRQVLDGNPLWYRDFARVLCNKLRLSLAHIESTYLPLSVRIVLRLLDLARAYGQPTEDSGIIIGLRLPQEDLARMLGLTRQSVNKELRALEDRGWLRIHRGRVTLLDDSALRRHVRETGGGDLLP
jgi:CRP/FNR family transcriptional regulator, cyclic AMP receptor protein